MSAGILQTANVIPLKSYLLEYYIKVASVKGAFFLYLNYGNKVVLYEHALMPVEGTTGWMHFKSPFTVPAGTADITLIVFFIFKVTSGSAYVDEVKPTAVTDSTISDFEVNISSANRKYHLPTWRQGRAIRGWADTEIRVSTLYLILLLYSLILLGICF